MPSLSAVDKAVLCSWLSVIHSVHRVEDGQPWLWLEAASSSSVRSCKLFLSKTTYARIQPAAYSCLLCKVPKRDRAYTNNSHAGCCRGHTRCTLAIVQCKQLHEFNTHFKNLFFFNRVTHPCSVFLPLSVCLNVCRRDIFGFSCLCTDDLSNSSFLACKTPCNLWPQGGSVASSFPSIAHSKHMALCTKGGFMLNRWIYLRLRPSALTFCEHSSHPAVLSLFEGCKFAVQCLFPFCSHKVFFCVCVLCWDS